MTQLGDAKMRCSRVSLIFMTVVGGLASIGCTDQVTAPHQPAPTHQDLLQGTSLISFTVRSGHVANEWLAQVYRSQPGGVAMFEERRRKGRESSSALDLEAGVEDDGPAVIHWVNTVADVIPNNTHVAADIIYSGHQARNEVTWTAFSHEHNTQLWQGFTSVEDLGDSQPNGQYVLTTDVQLTLQSYCGFRLLAGTTHNAWKQFRYPVLVRWGYAQTQFTSDQHPGIVCEAENECTESDSGQVTLRAAHSSSGPCGSQTGTPGGGGGGGGGDPPYPAEPNCVWYRDFVVYTDGSWDWLGPWEHYCEGDPMLRASPEMEAPSTQSLAEGGDAAVVSVASDKSMRLRLLGLDDLGTGRSTALHWYPALDADAEVRIALSKANASDLEAALFVVTSRARPDRNGNVGRVLGSPSGLARVPSGPGSRADHYLRALAAAPVAYTSSRGPARVLEIFVDRRTNRNSTAPGLRSTP